MRTIHAVYANGVFRPVEPVDLPEDTSVEFEPRLSAQDSGDRSAKVPMMTEGLSKIYEILGERYESGYPDTAARHDEHQP